MTAHRNHGLTVREQQIMALHETGSTIETIADALGLARGTVANILGYYDFRHVWANSERFERAVRSAERDYAAALLASGGRYA